ncbi:MAG: DUF547 domain-containing protein [Pseudomonadota bacterium]
MLDTHPSTIAPATNGVRRRTVLRGALAGALAGTVAMSAFSAPALADVGAYFDTHDATSVATVDHSIWDGLLKKYITVDATGLHRVDYRAWQQDRAPLQSYIKLLEGTKVTRLNRPEQFAFWANLYNAMTIDVVLRKYPVESIKNISLGGSLFSFVAGGPWDAVVTQVEGKELTLNNIEHDIMRPIFADPRVHYAVNCASVGCPNLAKDAFTGAELEQQLNAGAVAYVNSPRGVKVTSNGVVASKIYSWFRDDFGDSEADVIAHAAKYAAPDLKAQLAGKTGIYDHEYDWSLNDTLNATN